MKLIVPASPINIPMFYESRVEAMVIPLTAPYLELIFQRMNLARVLGATDGRFSYVSYDDRTVYTTTAWEGWEPYLDVEGNDILENLENGIESVVMDDVPMPETIDSINGPIIQIDSLTMDVSEGSVYWTARPKYEKIAVESGDVSNFLAQAQKALSDGRLNAFLQGDL